MGQSSVGHRVAEPKRHGAFKVFNYVLPLEMAVSRDIERVDRLEGIEIEQPENTGFAGTAFRDRLPRKGEKGGKSVYRSEARIQS